MGNPRIKAAPADAGDSSLTEENPLTENKCRPGVATSCSLWYNYQLKCIFSGNMQKKTNGRTGT